MKKTLVILAHPNLAQSRLNTALLAAIENDPLITIHDLYKTYNSIQDIDVAREQELLLAHDRIVFQFPLFWFSTPGLLKDWQDKVLEYGFAFGSEGNKLAGKEFKVAVTVGSPEYAYQTGSYIQASMSEILKPLQSMAIFTQMIFTQPFAVHRALKISDAELREKADAYYALLQNDEWSNSLLKYLASYSS